MDITPIPTTESATRSNSAATPLSEAGAIEADFDTFLSLLTAQLKNQDPLKPVDSTEFVAQLAEFSAVEQQVQSNASLADILETLQSGDITALADWLGAHVSTAETARFSGEPLSLSLSPHPEADRAALVVRDEAGAQAARLDIDPKTKSLAWSGENDLGRPPAPGRYRFFLESEAGGNPLPTKSVEVFVEVQEARLIDDAPQLTLSNGDVVGISEIVAVRSADD